MFLLHPTIFVWDFLILLLISIFVSGILVSTTLLRKGKKTAVEKFGIHLIGFLCLVGASVIIYGSFIEPNMIVVTEEQVDLPITDSLKIAVVGDFHVGPYKNKHFVERVVNETNRLLPDFILLVGDYIYTDDANISDLLPLRNLRASAGVYAVLGNHDQGLYRTFFGKNFSNIDRGEEVAKYLETLGITVLRNQHELVSLGEEQIVIAGIDDLWTGHGTVDKAFAGAPENTPSILLSHNPSVIDTPTSNRAQLIVSGHTHGGQIRIPGHGPIRSMPISIDQSYDHGIFPLDRNRTLAITRGVGESWARARLFAWPEIMLLTTK